MWQGQLKSPLTSYIRTPVQIPAALLLIQLPTPGKAAKDGPMLGPLPPMWMIRIEFQALGSLTQSPPLWLLGSGPVNGRSLSLPLYCSAIPINYLKAYGKVYIMPKHSPASNFLCTSPKIYLLLIFTYFHLFERTHTKGFPIFWFTPQESTTTTLGLVKPLQSLEAGIQSRWHTGGRDPST